MKKINFTKMVATGNDFVVMDNRFAVVGGRLAEFARKICNRKTGIGADGLLLVEKSKKADFRMRIFNPDGSEPDMCGNGSRCIALYAKKYGIAKSHMKIETGAGILSAVVKNNKVRINMTDPKALKLSIGLKANGKKYLMHHINTGVPHAVYFSGNIDAKDMYGLGRAIRYHNFFKPQGTNFNLVETMPGNAISIRTYERGVEEETLACGTGAVASAIISNYVKKLESPVKVHARGGKLTIYFKRKDNKFYDVFLEGEAQEVFKGEINL
jgi:diaminopimelate epimerase